jgi:phosphohistidine phosphatase SixA
MGAGYSRKVDRVVLSPDRRARSASRIARAFSCFASGVIRPNAYISDFFGGRV